MGTEYTQNQIRRYAKAVKVNGCLRLHINRYSTAEAVALAEAIGEHMEQPMDVEDGAPFLIIRPEED